MKWLIFPILILAMGLNQDEVSFRKDREDMVNSQIRARGVTDPLVLAAMRSVPRHRFVPDDMVAYAYDDSPLPIGHDQTISQPYIVAFMTEAIHPQADFRVLEVGTGSGYQAAVLAEIVDSVFTIEIIEKLGAEAKALLHTLEYRNVVVRIGDGYIGWEEKGPFDAIVVTAAAKQVPQPLIDQLKEGGRMIIPVGGQYQTQQLVLLEKKDGKVRRKNLMYVRFVPFTRPD
jgi:protein-L-isoaspartate(D-aspartate) O-methyltransferase